MSLVGPGVVEQLRTFTFYKPELHKDYLAISNHQTDCQVYFGFVSDLVINGYRMLFLKPKGLNDLESLNYILEKPFDAFFATPNPFVLNNKIG